MPFIETASLLFLIPIELKLLFNSAFSLVLFFKILIILPSLPICISLSNIILNYVENLAFNPAYISNYFSEEELREVKSEYIENISNPNSFTKVNIKLFRNSL